MGRAVSEEGPTLIKLPPGLHAQFSCKIGHMYPRLINLSKSRSFFIFGARGTGKTTLVHESLHNVNQFPKSEIYLLNLLVPEVEHIYALNPSRLQEEIDSLKKSPKYIIIDEIQRVPKLLDVVQEMMFNKKYIFIMTGSSARKLKRGAANLLAGRANYFELYPLTFLELGKDFNLNQTLQYGSLPEIFHIEEVREKIQYLKSYTLTYLKEEIKAEQLVKDLDPFRKFMEVVGECSGEIINFAKIGRQCGVDHKAIRRYFQILEDTLVGYFLDAYHTSIRAKQVTHPKFYLFDLGVSNALNDNFHNKLSSSTFSYGKSFEHFIFLEIKRLNQYFEKNFKLSYLKTDTGQEIDLIIEKGKKVIFIIEIKSSSSINHEDHLKHLKNLSEHFPTARKLVLCQEKVPRKIEGIEIFPWALGLQEIFELNL